MPSVFVNETWSTEYACVVCRVKVALGTGVPPVHVDHEVAVLPSHSEGMSNALLEYMAAGRAVVATDVGANAELVRDRKDGLIVPAGNPEAIADAVGELLANPLRAAGYGASARQRVEAEYSRAAMRKRFEEFYRGLAGAQGERGTFSASVP